MSIHEIHVMSRRFATKSVIQRLPKFQPFPNSFSCQSSTMELPWSSLAILSHQIALLLFATIKKANKYHWFWILIKPMVPHKNGVIKEPVPVLRHFEEPSEREREREREIFLKDSLLVILTEWFSQNDSLLSELFSMRSPWAPSRLQTDWPSSGSN